MARRTSDAQWEGTLREGKGRFWTGSGEVSGVFAFGTRFEEQPGTNPEELIGAAHASCFSMAFAGDLEKAGHLPESVHTTASVTLEKGEGTSVGCPVSKALAAVPISVNAVLVE